MVRRKKKHRKKSADRYPNLEARYQQWPFYVLEGIAAALLVVGYMLTISPSHKIATVWVFFAAYLLCGLGVAVKLTRELSAPAKTERCSVSIETAMTWSESWLWLSYGVGNEEVRSRIGALLFIRFTSLKPTPMLIDQYSFEIRPNGQRKWVAVKNMDARLGHVFFQGGKGKELSDAARLKIEEEEFNRLIENRNIGFHETIRGWVCLEVPNKYLDDATAKPFEWRFRMRNNDGTESVATCQSLSHTTVQRRFWTIGERRDISHLRQIPYAY